MQRNLNFRNGCLMKFKKEKVNKAMMILLIKNMEKL